MDDVSRCISTRLPNALKSFAAVLTERYVAAWWAEVTKTMPWRLLTFVLTTNHGTQHVDPVIISQKVIQGVYPGVTTSELDE